MINETTASENLISPYLYSILSLVSKYFLVIPLQLSNFTGIKKRNTNVMW